MRSPSEFQSSSEWRQAGIPMPSRHSWTRSVMPARACSSSAEAPMGRATSCRWRPGFFTACHTAPATRSRRSSPISPGLALCNITDRPKPVAIRQASHVPRPRPAIPRSPPPVERRIGPRRRPHRILGRPTQASRSRSPPSPPRLGRRRRPRAARQRSRRRGSRPPGTQALRSRPPHLRIHSSAHRENGVEVMLHPVPPGGRMNAGGRCPPWFASPYRLRADAARRFAAPSRPVAPATARAKSAIGVRMDEPSRWGATAVSGSSPV